jgi:RimJ/RimL family protein N-acetyltransferase
VNRVLPVTLSGTRVELRPLEADDRDGLAAASSDGELWNLQYTKVPHPDGMAEAIGRYHAMRDAGTMVPFTVRRRDTGAIVGITTYCNIDQLTPRVEIGYTWYATSVQRTGINAECKRLLLAHAFESLGCIAVEFRTHWLNHRSRGAIARLGAKQDGVLRSHQLMEDGALRDTVVFSIIACEWPAVRAELDRRLSR